MDSSTQTLCLPAEMEIAIFEIAIREYNAIHITRLAKHVQAWTEPIVYERVSLLPIGSPRTRRLLSTLKARPDLGLRVKSLILLQFGDEVEKTLNKILPICPGITSFTSHSRGWLKFLEGSQFRPRRLNVDAVEQPEPEEGYSFSSSRLYTPTTIFTHVTHLALASYPDNFLPNLHQDLPNLTHLALPPPKYYGSEGSPAFSRPLAEVLESPSQLVVLWLVINGLYYYNDFLDDIENIVGSLKDTRVVLLGGSSVLNDIPKGWASLWDEAENIALKQKEAGTIFPRTMREPPPPPEMDLFGFADFLDGPQY